MKRAGFLLLFVVVLHFVANALGIYDAQIAAGNVWIDNVLHALVGLAAGVLWIDLFKSRQSTVFILGFVAVLALVWELLEFGFYAIAPDQALELKIYSPSLAEAGIDVLSNMGGAMLLIVWKFLRK